ncbi:MAG: MFS transporter [Candidatus Hydrogenedentes bacterium]|nr:MFS transporter [Candidatus Hydrogenedentota bacterium]
MKPSCLISLCHGGMICVAIGVNLMPVYLTTFAATFGGLNEEQLGRIPAFMFAGVVAGILLSGPLADRFGVRFFTVSGMAVAALGLILMSAARGYGALLAAGTVSGLGAGILDMAMSPIVSAVCPDRRTAALNRLHAYYCIGGVGTVLAAAAGLHFGVSWRFVAAIMTLIPLALLIAFAFVPLPPLVHPDHTREGLRRLLRQPRFLLALAIIALAGATEAGIMQWLPAYSERVLGYGKTTGGAALILFSLGMAGGRMLASHRLNRLGPYALLIFPGAFCIILYLLGSLLTLPLPALSACVLVGLGCSVLWPTSLGNTADRFPRGGASLFAVLAGTGNIGCLAMPWIIGLVAEGRSLRAGLLAGTLAPLLLLLLATAAWVADRRALSK